MIHSSTIQRTKIRKRKEEINNCRRPAGQLRVHTASSSYIELPVVLLYEVTTTAAVHDEVYARHQQ